MHILRQYVFLIPITVMFLSEFAKVVVEYFRTGQWHAGIFRTGGMPSTHSAFVTSLLIVIERKSGMESIQFAIAFVLAAVVWYDAVSLRREVGLQAEMLNKLQNFKHFSERVGHSIKEVIAGIIFGTAVTYIGIWLS